MSEKKPTYDDGISEELLWNPENNSFMKRSLFPGKWIPTRISIWDADNPQYQYQPSRDRTYQEAMKSVADKSGLEQLSASPSTASLNRNYDREVPVRPSFTAYPLPNKPYEPPIELGTPISIAPPTQQKEKKRLKDPPPIDNEDRSNSWGWVKEPTRSDANPPFYTLYNTNNPNESSNWGKVEEPARSGAFTTTGTARPRQEAERTMPDNPYAVPPQQNAAKNGTNNPYVISNPEKNYGWDILSKSPLLSTFAIPDPPRQRQEVQYEGPLSNEEMEQRRIERLPGGFHDQVAKVLESEGGYVNSRYDSGGATNHGISWDTWEAFAKKHVGVEPTIDNLKKLTPEGAKRIYKAEFWKPSKAGEINDPVIRQLYFDFYINSGRKAAVKLLQRAVNQQGGRVDEDGIVGSGTVEALNRHPDPGAIYEQYRQNRMDNYYKIAETREGQKQNLKGWLNRMDKFKPYDEMLKQY